LRADGFIVRAQAAIGTDRFVVRAGFANTCALRAPTSSFVRIQTIRTKDEVLQLTKCFARQPPLKSILKCALRITVRPERVERRAVI
jgi:hypothetical protein